MNMHAASPGHSVELRRLAPKPRGPALRRAMGLVTLAWVFGSVFVTGTGGATFTVFATKLGLTPFQFGLLAAAPYVASLASLPASLLIDRTGRRKPIFLTGLYLQRLMWVPIALGPVYLVGVGGPWGRTAGAVFSGWSSRCTSAARSAGRRG